MDARTSRIQSANGTAKLSDATKGHRSCCIAISNRRLIAFNNNGVTFRYKDYRADNRARYKTMTLVTDEFIRRFLIHILPNGLGWCHPRLSSAAKCFHYLTSHATKIQKASPTGRPN